MGAGKSKGSMQLISIFLETNGIAHNGAETSGLITNISVIHIFFKQIENHSAGRIYSRLTTYYIYGTILGRVKHG